MEEKGFNPKEAKEWKEKGFTPKEAKEWKEIGFNPTQAKIFKSKGYSVNQIIKEKRNIIIKNLIVKVVAAVILIVVVNFYYQWSKAGFSIIEALKWRTNNFSLEQAKLWKEDGFDSNEAKLWKNNGFNSKEALEIKKQKIKIINYEKASNYVNQEVLVEGKVIQIYVSKNGNVFLNFGNKFPNNTFTAVIFKSDVDKFVKQFGSIYMLENKKVIIRGKVEIYKRKPEIILKSPYQIKITN